MFGFGLLDPVEPLTPLGMRLVGVFLDSVVKFKSML